MNCVEQRGADWSVPVHRPRHDDGRTVGADAVSAVRRHHRAVGTARQIADALGELFVWLLIGVVCAGIFSVFVVIVAMIVGVL